MSRHRTRFVSRFNHRYYVCLRPSTAAQPPAWMLAEPEAEPPAPEYGGSEQPLEAADEPHRALLQRMRGRFVVFSGGKLEHRKGQDVAVAAFRDFQKTHPQLRPLLVTAWYHQVMSGVW